MSVLDEKIEKAKKICILGHINPDGDCLGSVLAIYNYILNKWGNEKNVKPYLQEFTKKYLIMPNADKISYDTNDAIIYDLAIVVDCGLLDRLKDYGRYFTEAKDTIVFDHHENNKFEADVKVVDKDAMATCEILYEYFDKKYINKDVAICLYIGIATDSGIFRYKATTKKTFDIAGELIEYGFDFTYYLDVLVFDNTITQRKAQAIVFNRIKLFNKGTVSFSYILQEELDELNIGKSEIDNIIVYLREITGVKVAAFVYPSGREIYKMSLRSKDDNINVARFAEMHDGGGHALASGCLYYGKIENIEKQFENDIIDFMK